MHLPGPLRAAVGLAATAAAEVKHLPDRAIELPMLAVSTALQASLRAQQRYARLAARGDEVLNRRPPTPEPPPWATFDEPVSMDEPRRSVFGSADASGGAAAMSLDELFGVADPTVESVPEKPASKKSASKKPAPKKKPAKTTTDKSDSKRVSKPRHTAPSAFDSFED